MSIKIIGQTKLILGLMTALLVLWAAQAPAAIDGLTGTTFNLTAKSGSLSTADGNSLFFWGYANGNGLPQYPGPTLIVNEGDTVTINLVNQLPKRVSMVFPGQQRVKATGGVSDLLTRAAPPDGVTPVTYTFTASKPGTYTYYSGSFTALEVQMGLAGVIIVRPAGFNPASPTAYGTLDSGYDREFLFFLSEIDPTVNQFAEAGRFNKIDATKFRPVYWLINGRTAPDTMAESNVAWLPYQPYNSMPKMHPGERVLMRVVGGGRDMHPFHHHGNHARIIARDGRLLQSAPGAGADLSEMVFTITSAPGETVDGIFEWTGARLGYDIYGHEPGDPLEPNEYAPDHGKPFQVILPEPQDTLNGDFWSGSPFLGSSGTLPPGQGNFNPNAAFTFMWHSHNEDEIVNNNIFPGGMLTMMFVEHPAVVIME